MVLDTDIDLICSARHGDAFSVLGPHLQADGKVSVRTFLPQALSVQLIDPITDEPIGLMKRHGNTDFFSGTLATGKEYRIAVLWRDTSTSQIDDPYRFPPILSAEDSWLLAEGTHLRPYQILGAHPEQFLGARGVRFAVWAPSALRVSVVGDFNHWDGRRHPMRLRRECGVWEIFIPDVNVGTQYKYEIIAANAALLPLKADPYAFAAELRPATASIIAAPLPAVVPPKERQLANAVDAPISIYEVHLASWRASSEDGARWMDWTELAQTLIPYALDMGFTHIELLPISEYPFDGSWGYQPVGLYAPTARHGDAKGLREFVQACHAAGLGVIVDWVPAHFPSDAHGLAQFDGSHLYEHADPREGFHNDWNTLIYNLGRNEVRNFLVGNALYWLEQFNVDGLRVDAVASMLYRDYSRKEGEWIPNIHGGRENLESIAFLKRVNDVIAESRPGAMTLAEESTSFPNVSHPTSMGGLGFNFKWNMGWMHDTLCYMARDPIHRQYHHDEMTFGLVYAFNENFVLPISHDEVVHGKGSMLTKMPGDEWQKFANLRAYYGFMFAHPGKKLLFMGCEFAQTTEWNHDQNLPWHLLNDAKHQGVQSLVRDLNRLYQSDDALYSLDCAEQGFEWIDYQDKARSILSFVRRNKKGDALMLIVCNFTPMPHLGLRMGVPQVGTYRECLNTDAAHYGGSNVGTPLGVAKAEAISSHQQAWSITIDVPPLATVFFKWER